MKLLAKDLSLHLKRTLANFYFVWGDDPFHYKEAIDLIRTQTKLHGYTEHELYEYTPSFKTGALFQSLKTVGLFTDQRLVELRFVEGKIPLQTVEWLEQLSALVIPPDIIFLLSILKPDKKFQQSSCFQQLQSKGCTVLTRSLSKKEALSWLEQKCQQFDLKLSTEAMNVLFERTEGNLLEAVQTIEKLALQATSSVLSVQDISQVVGKEARFTLYELVDTALSGSSLKTSQIFYSLKNEGVDPILINWVITREVRNILLLISHKTELPSPVIWKQRESLIKNFIARFSIKELHQALLRAKTIDMLLKRHEIGNAWDHLLSLCLMLSGTRYG